MWKILGSTPGRDPNRIIDFTSHSNNQTGQHCIWTKLARIILNGHCPFVYKSCFAPKKKGDIKIYSSKYLNARST